MLQNVFHYENGMIECFKFVDNGHGMTPLKLELDAAIMSQKTISSVREPIIDAMYNYDEFIVYRKGNFLVTLVLS